MLKQILNRWNAYFIRFYEFSDVLVGIQEIQNGTISKLKALEELIYPCNCLDINDPVIYSALVEFGADTSTTDEKSAALHGWALTRNPATLSLLHFTRSRQRKEINDSSGGSDLLEKFQSRRGSLPS